MCAVNDAKRAEYDTKIKSLKAEYDNEKNKLDALKKATGELKQLVDAAQCTIDNISECNFGGDKILSSVTTSQQGYNARVDYYEEYTVKCKTAMEAIEKEIEQTTALRNAVPKDCGICDECKPQTRR